MIAIGLAMALKRRKTKRSKWTKDWLLKRDQFSHTNLLVDLKLEPDGWRNYLLMNEDTYLDLLEKVAMACVVLHNYLRITCPSEYSPAECFHRDDVSNKISVPGLSVDPDSVSSLTQGQGVQNYPQIAKDVRVKFKEFFNNEGAVPWQKDFM